MKFVSAAVGALALSFAASAFAADAPAKTLTPQQQRMKDCNTQATGKKGDERRAFMSTCLKGSSASPASSVAAAAPAQGAQASTPQAAADAGTVPQAKKKSHRGGATTR